MLQLGDKGTTTWFKCLVCSRCYPVEEKLIVHKTTTNCRFHYRKAFKRHKRDYKRLKVLKRSLGYVVSSDDSSTSEDSDSDSSGSVVIEAVIHNNAAKRPRLEEPQGEQNGQNQRVARQTSPRTPPTEDEDEEDSGDGYLDYWDDDHLSTAETVVVAENSDVAVSAASTSGTETNATEVVAIDDSNVPTPAKADSPTKENALTHTPTSSNSEDAFDKSLSVSTSTPSASASPSTPSASTSTSTPSASTSTSTPSASTSTSTPSASASTPRTNKLECYFCSEEFMSLPALNKHMRDHTKEKEFQCRSCGSFFTFRHQVEYHQIKSRTCL